MRKRYTWSILVLVVIFVFPFVTKASADLYEHNTKKNRAVFKISESNHLQTVQHRSEKNKAAQSHNGFSYRVRKGNTLWSIAQRYDISVDAIKEKNGLYSNLLLIGQELVIPIPSGKIPQSDKNLKPVLHPVVPYTKEDFKWLNKIIEAEAEDEPYMGKVAVGSVVVNRIQDEWFPDTVQSVVFQRDEGVYQFTPVANGRIYRVTPSEDSYKAAIAALEGKDPTNGAMYFYNPKIAKSDWIRTREIVTVIGQHTFAQ